MRYAQEKDRIHIKNVIIFHILIRIQLISFGNIYI
jgi:hypothetical protein